MKVYTRLEGKLAQWDVDTCDYVLAVQLVKKELGRKHVGPVLAVIECPQQMELDL